jgi:hypothetical protein
MKRQLPLFIIAVFLGFVAFAAARTWKSGDGRFSTDAEAIGFQDGKVQLKKSDGNVIEVPLASLGEEDRRYVASRFPEAAKSGDSADAADYREWATSNGKFRTRAKFLGTSGNRVRLQKPDGAEISVEKKLLSEDDQRWIDKEGGKRDDASDDAPSSDKEIAAQEVEMKLVELPSPKAAGRSKSMKVSDYLARLCQPRSLYILLKDQNVEAAFHRVVKKEPTYNSAAPVRGTVTFGSREYGFALDAKNSTGGGYDQLYFDSDGDGDLTNDKPISALGAGRSNAKISQLQFPRVRVSVKLDGGSYEYGFFVSAMCNQSGSNEYVLVSLTPASYREGVLAQGSKRTKVILLDRNCNGRFDDAVTWNPGGGVGNGDMLLVDPKPKAATGSAALDRDQNFVGKIVSLHNRFYRLEVQPSGSSLKVSPLQCSTGSVTHPKFAYSATLFNEQYGAVVANGMKNQKVLLPEGKWKLGGYTMHEGAEGGKRPTSLTAASGGGDTSVVTVSKDTPAVLPLGEPFRATVTAARTDKGVSLSLMIVGAAGERCTGLLVKGARPPKPHFVIKDKSDKIVKEGDFEYG